MAAPKNTTLTLRIEPTLKKAIQTAAKAEHRSFTNMIEVLIRDHCKRQGIVIENFSDGRAQRRREQQ